MSQYGYYCNQKFWWLSVDLAKKQSFSCCAATPHRIDVKWLEQNPGRLFNTPHLQHERREMLQDIPVKSCESGCWIPESDGLTTSRRLIKKGYIRSHTDIESTPEYINLVLSNHCNLSCVYCCKQYSSAWARDIMQNGTYPLTRADDRYQLNTLDQLLSKISQSDVFESASNQQIIDEIIEVANSTDDLSIQITGGEPLLHNSLGDLVSGLPQSTKITIASGLGVSHSRLEKILDKLKCINNVTLSISAESVGKLYEIVRYGHTWDKFEKNIRLIEQAGIKYNFSGSISNLNIIGIPEFERWASGKQIRYSYVNDPIFLSLHVMDQKTKDDVLDNIDQYPESIRDTVKDTIQVECSIQQKKDFIDFFKEFARRRDIDFSVYPKNFYTWINEG